MPEDRHSGVPGGNGSGANVKGGIITGVSDGDTGSVSFATPFTSTPAIVLNLKGLSTAIDIPHVTGFNAAGFAWRLYKGHGGGDDTWDIHWIATDAGDP